MNKALVKIDSLFDKKKFRSSLGLHILWKPVAKKLTKKTRQIDRQKDGEKEIREKSLQYSKTAILNIRRLTVECRI